MIPICIATVHGKGLAVLLESIRQYAPEHPVYLHGPESVIEKFDATLKIFGQPSNLAMTTTTSLTGRCKTMTSAWWPTMTLC